MIDIVNNSVVLVDFDDLLCILHEKFRYHVCNPTLAVISSNCNIHKDVNVLYDLYLYFHCLHHALVLWKCLFYTVIVRRVWWKPMN